MNKIKFIVMVVLAMFVLVGCGLHVREERRSNVNSLVIGMTMSNALDLMGRTIHTYNEQHGDYKYVGYPIDTYDEDATYPEFYSKRDLINDLPFNWVVLCFKDSLLVNWGEDICNDIKISEDNRIRKEKRTSLYVYTNTTIHHDKYTKRTTISGPYFENDELLELIHMRTIDVGNLEYNQIYISTLQSTWNFYYTAYDHNGNKLDFVKIQHIVNDDSDCREVFAITLTNKQLNDAIKLGMNFKVVGDRGDRIIKISSYYFKGFMDKVNYYKTKL